MTAYTVINRTPFFRWRQNTLKAKDGNLDPGFALEGTTSGEYLIVNQTLPGGDYPPYALALADLQDNTPLPPPSGGVPDPVPAGKFPITFNGEPFVNDDDINWIRLSDWMKK